MLGAFHWLRVPAHQKNVREKARKIELINMDIYESGHTGSEQERKKVRLKIVIDWCIFQSFFLSLLQSFGVRHPISFLYARHQKIC